MSNETVVHLAPRERIMLNADLIKERNLSEEIVNKIVDVHECMEDVLDNPEDYDDPVALVEQYELWLQRLWGFTQDRNYHIHWMRIKGCKCPKGDNRLWTGLDRRFISTNCPWHYKGE